MGNGGGREKGEEDSQEEKDAMELCLEEGRRRDECEGTFQCMN